MTSQSLPDLSTLRPNTQFMMAAFYVAGTGPKDRRARMQAVNFIRTTDLAIAQYESARIARNKWLGDPGSLRLTYMLQVSDHLELCLVCVKRAVLAMHRLAAARSDRLVPRSIRRIVESYDSEITDVRDTIVHMDEMIERGEIKDGQAIAVLLTKDGESIEIGSEQLSFARLAQLLTRLHSLAYEIAKYKPAADGAAT